MSLVARLLEEAGIPTVILGSGKDIVEYCGVPRFLFSDFPLGNPCGVPWNMGVGNSISSGFQSGFAAASFRYSPSATAHGVNHAAEIRQTILTTNHNFTRMLSPFQPAPTAQHVDSAKAVYPAPYRRSFDLLQ